jgi:hypothetical protein
MSTLAQLRARAAIGIKPCVWLLQQPGVLAEALVLNYPTF